MKREELESRLLEFVRRVLLGAEPTLTLDEDTALFEEGIVNSLRILDLIAFVESETQRHIPDEAIRLANFRSVRAIAAAFGAPGERHESSTTVLRTFKRGTGRRTPGIPPPRAGLARSLDELKARGELELVPPGRAIFRGAPRRLLRYFDSVALVWAREMGAEERRFPSRISPASLARAGCPVGSSCAETVMPSAACYHVYPAFQGRLLTDRRTLLTVRGRCFRDESAVALSTGRFRHFQMREIVALGAREEVEHFRQELIAKVSEFVTQLDLEGRIETASDPFFAPDSREREQGSRADEMRGRRLMQQVLPLKYELRLALGEDGYPCAAASFNHHLDFFGRRFGLRLRSGAKAHSGCVAFGLERWVLAFLGRHGIDERNWPAQVRQFCATRNEHARLA